MNTPRAVPPLDQLDDGELAALALTWRSEASRGDRNAYGIAHALEVEQRRRRAKQAVARPNKPSSVSGAPRSWWKFWQADATRNHPDEPTE